MPNQPAYVKQQPQEPYQLPSARWMDLRKARPRAKARLTSFVYDGEPPPHLESPVRRHGASSIPSRHSHAVGPVIFKCHKSPISIL